MKIKKILFILFLLINLKGFSQDYLEPLATNYSYKNTHSNVTKIEKALQLPNGDAIIIGYQDANFTSTDVYVIKINAQLETVWKYVISTPDSSSFDYFQNAEIDQNGSLYIYSTNIISVSSNVYQQKHYITKLNNAGVLIFQKSLNDIALENNIYTNYISNYYTTFYSHLDDENNFVIVYSGHSPSQEISFFKFKPNNTISITKRTDILQYNPNNDQSGYLVRFFYDHGNYYYLTGVKKQSLSGGYEIRINKMHNIGYTSLDISNYIGNLQVMLLANIQHLRSNVQGNILYLTIGGSNVSLNFKTLIFNSNMNYIGTYFDDAKLNNYASSYVMPNGNLKIFSHTESNDLYTLKLIETILSPTGTLVSETIKPETPPLKITNIDSNSNAIIKESQIEIVDNDWNLIKEFQNPGVHDILSIKKVASDYYFYSNEYGFMYGTDQNINDRVTSHVFKFSPDEKSNKSYTHIGEGTAFTVYAGKTISLGDASRIFFYKFSKGVNSSSSAIINEPTSYVKRVDKDLNTLWELPTSLNIFSNIIRDEDNNIFFCSSASSNQTTNGQAYYLNKMSPTGELIYQVPYTHALEIFIKDTHIYSIVSTSAPNSTILTKTNKDTGITEEESSFPKSKFSTHTIDNNGDIYLYQSKELNLEEDLEIEIYKNFEKINGLHLPFEKNSERSFIADPVTKTLYFTARHIEYNKIKLVKLDVDGSNEMSESDVTSSLTPVFIINDGVFFTTTDQLIKFDKNNLEQVATLPKYFITRFYKIDNEIMVVNKASATIIKYDEALNYLAEYLLEDGNHDYIYFTEDKKLHVFSTITSSIGLSVLPRWGVNRLTLYDFNIIALSTEPELFIPESSVKIYPNPTMEFVNIETHNTQFEAVYVYDLNGKFLFKSNQPTFSVAHLNSGIYLLQILTNDNKIHHSKIIKK